MTRRACPRTACAGCEMCLQPVGDRIIYSAPADVPLFQLPKGKPAAHPRDLNAAPRSPLK